MYAPLSPELYTAVYAGTLAGMRISGRINTSPTASVYADSALSAGTFARAFDTTWALWGIPLNQLNLTALSEACEGFWRDRSPADNAVTTDYTESIQAIIAAVRAAELYYAVQGITPPPLPGGGSPAVDWNDAIPNAHQNIQAEYAAWTGVPGQFTQALTDNSKKGIVNLASDTNDEAPLQDAIGCVNNWAFAVGNMPSITGEYAGGGGYRPNARNLAAWAFGYSSFADGEACFTTGRSCVSGALGSMVGSPQLTFTAATQNINRDSGSWIDDGFTPGVYVTITGSGLNNVSGEAVTVTATDITLDAAGIVDEGPISGVTITYQARYAVASGRQCQARAPGSITHGYLSTVEQQCLYGIAMGYNSSVVQGGRYGVALGNQCISQKMGGVALGVVSIAGGENSFAAGFGNQAMGDDSLALGDLSQATANYAVAIGHNVIASGQASTGLGYGSTPSRYGELAHSSDQTTGLEGYHGIDLQEIANAVPVVLTDADGFELTFPDNQVISLRLRLLASQSAVVSSAVEVHEITLQSSGGTLVMLSDILVSSPAVALVAKGWTLTISVTGLTLRFQCDPVADIVQFGARVEWSALPGAATP